MLEFELMTNMVGYNDLACPPDCDDCSPFACNPDASCGPDYDWEEL